MSRQTHQRQHEESSDIAVPTHRGGQAAGRLRMVTLSEIGAFGVGGGKGNGQPSASNWIGPTPDAIGGLGIGGGNGEPESRKTAAAKIMAQSRTILVERFAWRPPVGKEILLGGQSVKSKHGKTGKGIRRIGEETA